MNAATPEDKPMTEEISDSIERVTFQSDESSLRESRDDCCRIIAYGDVRGGRLVGQRQEHGLQFKAAMMPIYVVSIKTA